MAKTYLLVSCIAIIQLTMAVDVVVKMGDKINLNCIPPENETAMWWTFIIQGNLLNMPVAYVNHTANKCIVLDRYKSYIDCSIVNDTHTLSLTVQPQTLGVYSCGHSWYNDIIFSTFKLITIPRSTIITTTTPSATIVECPKCKVCIV